MRRSSLYRPQVIEIITRKIRRGYKLPKIHTRTCQVCGKEFKSAIAHARFCSARHKVIFNNIRRTRGAQLYDFFMTLRYDRERAQKLDVWSCLCALAMTFREADKGKVSWGDVAEHLEKMPYLKKAPDLVDRFAKKKAGD
jgi:hypothetical protein